MIRQTPAARQQAEALIDFYLERNRYEAARNLVEAIDNAARQIEAHPNKGLDYPRPYPQIARWRFLWLKVHRYWFGWSMVKGYPVITNVHYDASQMQARVSPDDENDVPI